MTSYVAALSGIVPNGHQTLYFVSSAPSKIPYGGFSQHRLHTRLTRRPPSQMYPRLLIGRHSSYLQLQRLIRNRTRVQAAPKISDLNREFSGPWLLNRLCCPAGSSLIMATFTLLAATHQLMNYFAELRGRHAHRIGSPFYSANPYCLRHFCTGSATASLNIPEHVGCVTELQRSHYTPALRCCSLIAGQDFYYRFFTVRIAPSCVSYSWMVHRHLSALDIHRFD